jgi:hypothetical protein
MNRRSEHFMSNSIKALALGLGLMAGTAMVAQAQSNLSALPPGGGTPAAMPNAVAPSAPYPGPAVGSAPSIPNPTTQAAVVPSGTYPGPAAGAGTGQMPPHFQKPAGYDDDPSMNPYTRGLGPKPN